jgi:hypothetical protein
MVLPNNRDAITKAMFSCVSRYAMLRIWASIDPKVIVSDSFPLITIIAALLGRMRAASTTRWQKLCSVTRLFITHARRDWLLP